jgi:Carboxypeptidase regulatory-like domain
MSRTKHFTLSILFALISIPVCAQEEATTGIINGRAVNERGEPMPGASVSLRAVGTFVQGRSTTSDAEGNFRFEGLEPALYQISGYAPAYILQSTETNSAEPYHRVGDSVRLEFIKGGVITGTVTNAAGEPVVGVRVRAFRVRDLKGKRIQTAQFGSMERPTDDRGIYRLYGLTPGTYVVTAGGGNNQSYVFNPFETDVPIYSPSSTRDTATEYTVRSGEETTADIRYRSDPGHTISGTVRVAGNNGAGIMIVSSDGMFIPSSNGFQQPGARGFSINGLGDGEYTLYAQEMVIAPPSPSTVPDLSLSDPKRVTIKGADVTGIELVPKPLSSISGIVSLETSKAPECQGKRKPVFGEMLVELQRHEKDTELIAPFLRSLQSSATPNQKGAFTLRNLTPGRYRFNPRFYARYWYLQSISTGAPAAPSARISPSKNDAAANWMTVKAGEQVSNLTITLAEGAASVRGKIVVAEGATIPVALSVYLVPAEREKADDVLRYFVTQAGADGAFTLNNVAPGKYFTLVQNVPSPETETLLQLRLPESAEARTKLRRAAETQKSDLELKPCQTLADYQLSLK